MRGAKLAWEAGYQFVDVKHCHGYLGHEFLSAYQRPGPYGGSFENRTRFARQIIEGIRTEAPGLQVGVRLSVFDFVPFRPDPEGGDERRMGSGIPEDFAAALPYDTALVSIPLIHCASTQTRRFNLLRCSVD